MADLRKGYWVELLPTERSDGQLVIAFIARRTFTIPDDDATIQPLEDDDQPPMLEADRYDDGDAESAAPTLESDLVGEKARCDVIVVGKTYAPSGKPAREWECAIRVGTVLRRMRAIGPRQAHYTRPLKKDGKPLPQPPRFSEPTPVKEVPLSMAYAYGGQTWVIPDPQTLAISRQVEGVMAEEGKADREAKAALKEAKAEEAAKKQKEADEKAFLEAPVGGGAGEDEKLNRAWGEFGYDDDGVRVWGEATSKRGTAVMDLDGFAAWQAAQDEAAAAGVPAPAKDEIERRRNAAGEALETDDGVAILTDDLLAEALSEGAAEQADLKAVQAAAAQKRRRDEVLQSDGTQMFDAADLPDEDDPAPAWNDDLREDLKEIDAEERALLDADHKARAKLREEKLAEFPKLPCPTNPYGRGFIVSNVPQLVEGLLLPQLEDPDAPLTPRDLIQDIYKMDAVPLPAAFCTYPRQAHPRVGMAGDYPSDMKDYEAVLEAHKRSLDLDDDDDVRLLRELDKRPIPGMMQPGWFNSAAPTLQLASLQGDEEITLTNLTKEGTLFFRLPGKALEAELDRGAGVERKDLTLDTMIIEADSRTVTMLWRAHYEFADWEALESYPNLVGWVLDLDVKDRRNRDWEEATAKQRGEGTATLDISELDLDGDNAYWRTISDERKAKEAAATAAAGGTAALDIERMGLYRQGDDDDAWVKEASDGTVDVSAEAEKKKEEEAYLEKKLAAMKAAEAKDKEDEIRREEVGAAAAAGKPIPPKDADKTPVELKKAKEARAKATAAAAPKPKPPK